jgi:hypothetical protein
MRSDRLGKELVWLAEDRIAPRFAGRRQPLPVYGVT